MNAVRSARAHDAGRASASYAKYARLTSEGFVPEHTLTDIVNALDTHATSIEGTLSALGVPKHELLRCASEFYALPFIEYHEDIKVSEELLQRVNLDRLKDELWFPLAIRGTAAEVVACYPDNPGLQSEIKKILGVNTVHLRVALACDIVAFIESHQDINLRFPPSSGRTSLAKLRTWLAGQRCMLSTYRTALAKGRTGLAFIRTGISFISIGLVMFRIFGLGYLSILEGALVVLGALMAVDGFLWYMPTHNVRRRPAVPTETEPTFGSTILEMVTHGEEICLVRSGPIAGGDELRRHWGRLTPVMRRRFLAIDRTDLAEERTILAGYRTVMAQTRTGLAFTRTGVAFLGLGIALFKQFHTGPWTIFDLSLILFGGGMMLEGLYWYFPGHRAGRKSIAALQQAGKRTSIWDFMFPRLHKRSIAEDRPLPLSISACHAPGILGTTGLALERTLIAERRNVKSRLRTTMAQSRTGLAFIRTGTSTMSVGMGLLVYFGFGNFIWVAVNVALIGIGMALAVDGTIWHFPAEKMRRQLPYCFSDMELAFPEYAVPCESWQKVVFNHD